MIKLATVFSGIGAIESALDYLNLEKQIIFACDNGERELNFDYAQIDKMMEGKSDYERQKIIKKLYDDTGRENLVKKTYFANYKINGNQWFEDIKYLNGTLFRNQIDLYVGGSPCQSFSVNGKRAGLSDVRGTLFYEYARIIKESQPKVFIYENVRGMLNHDNGNTWKIVKEVFESLNYDIYIDSKDFSVKEKDNVPENTSIFYINKEFNKNKKNQIRKIDDIEYLENGEKNIVVNEDVEIAATYNFIKDNVRYNGDIYASSEDTYDSIENKIEEIMLQINEGIYFDGHNISSKSRFVGQFYKDANWVCISEKKLILYVHIKMSILVTILNGERH